MTTQAVSGIEHQELFVSSLKQEIYELRQRQRDFSQLAEQLKFLEGKYRQSQDDRVSYLPNNTISVRE